MEALGNAQDILKYGDQAINILSKLFIDYDRNLMFLDSLERNASLNGEMKECFAELRGTYEHGLKQTLREIGQQIMIDGVDYLYSIPVVKVVGVVKKSIGIIGDISGENAKTAAQYELLTYGTQEVYAAQTAFTTSLEKLRAASEDAENYTQLMDDFKNCFTIYKTSMKRLFEKMAVAADSPQRDYYYYCSSLASSLNLKNYSETKFMTYEEYLKVGYAS